MNIPAQNRGPKVLAGISVITSKFIMDWMVSVNNTRDIIGLLNYKTVKVQENEKAC